MFSRRSRRWVATAVERSEPEPPGAQLGVLFVHGMGSAVQGGTLRQHAEPLVGWLTTVFKRAELVDVVMTPGDGEPAHATCELYVVEPAGGRAVRRPLTRWLFAESHWAQTFKPPTYLRIAAWLIGSVPWMLGEYARNAQARERTRASYHWRPLLIRLYVAGATVLAGPIVVLLALLVPAQYVPIAKFRHWAAKLPRALSASLGDVYIILATHVDREAIRTRIVRDYNWLAARCETKVVVAHSAGSALTHQLIRDGRIRDVDTYVTLGEAIWRMQWMKQLAAMPVGRRMSALGLALLGFALWVAAVVVGALLRSPYPVLVGWTASALVQWASAHLVWNERDAAKNRLSAIDVLIDGDRPLVRRWHDYVASSDPVPGGVLYDESDDISDDQAVDKPDRSFYRPSWIRNARSVILDHVTYPRNLEEYVAGLGADLVASDRSIQDRPLIPAAVAARAVIARELRTLSLTLARLASAVFAGVTLAVLYWPGQPGLARLGERAQWASKAMTTSVEKVPGSVTLDAGIAGLLTGAALVIAMIAAAWIPVLLCWKAWDSTDRRRFTARQLPLDVVNTVPVRSLTPTRAGPRPVDRHFALLWFGCSAAALAVVLCLAESVQRFPLPAATLIAGALLVAFTRRIARSRDNAYGSPAAS